ncbi:hypothetical protein GGX14DRAFT_658055 [Mycena pura]|uniref:Uncharacterized protein n=1 Tax=Mycena pura TaxID=153505 RepID=A0AAD6YM96_9AGAR|nr:hypothetical protein GGX14DRAFT_658055 [Mycena pura]
MNMAPPPPPPSLLHEFKTLLSASLDTSAPGPALTLAFPVSTPLLPPVEKKQPHRMPSRARRLLARLKLLVRRQRLRLGGSASRAVRPPAAVAVARTAVSPLLANERPLIMADGTAPDSTYSYMHWPAPPSSVPSDRCSPSASSSPGEMSHHARFHIPAPPRPLSVFTYDLVHGDPFAKDSVSMCVVDRSCKALPYPQQRQRARLDSSVMAPLDHERDTPTPTPRSRFLSRTPVRGTSPDSASSAFTLSSPSPHGADAGPYQWAAPGRPVLTRGRSRSLAPSAYAPTPLAAPRRPRAGSPYPLRRNDTRNWRSLGLHPCPRAPSTAHRS